MKCPRKCKNRNGNIRNMKLSKVGKNKLYYCDHCKTVVKK